jgi:hypothetical protein
MPEKLQEELSQLTDEEIEKRLAAAVWVDDKRAAVLRYLEDKKLDRKKEAQVAELEVAPKTPRGRPWTRLRWRSGRRTSPSR